MKKYLVHLFYIAAISVIAVVQPTQASDVTNQEPVVVVTDEKRVITGDPIPGSETTTLGEPIREKVVSIIRDNSGIEKVDGSFKERFFSIDRSNPYIGQPYTEEEEAILQSHPELANQPDSAWDGRVANCETLSIWEAYYECMFKPWKYGF
jgi:hypothetical protein